MKQKTKERLKRIETLLNKLANDVAELKESARAHSSEFNGDNGPVKQTKRAKAVNKLRSKPK
jgi:hypothetical protein